MAQGLVQEVVQVLVDWQVGTQDPVLSTERPSEQREQVLLVQFRQPVLQGVHTPCLL